MTETTTTDDPIVNTDTTTTIRPWESREILTAFCGFVVSLAGYYGVSITPEQALSATLVLIGFFRATSSQRTIKWR